jgi:transcriptional regulator with XRE-family HTH domain
MVSMLSILLKPPADILTELGQRAKIARLALKWTRKTLSERSGVPEATIKRFESSGLLGTAALIDIATALDMIQGFERLFEPKPIRSIDDIQNKKRKRGSL